MVMAAMAVDNVQRQVTQPEDVLSRRPQASLGGKGESLVVEKAEGLKARHRGLLRPGALP
jgi:hypothetical protein